MKINECRSCSKKNLKTFLDLGVMPLAGALLDEKDLGRPEPAYPLEAAFCPDCGLAQILETVPAETLFCINYPYYSSFSDEFVGHARENALEIISSRGLGPQSLAVEIASNDGYLLKNFVEKGIPCIGIDPAEGPARTAEKAGVRTLREFFGVETAQRLRQRLGRGADVIIANNVLAHSTDTNDFVEGIRLLLEDDGMAIIEVPYVKELIRNFEFDTIYHEHLCYFSAASLDGLLRRHSLYINDIRKLAVHGGSLRIYAGRKENPSCGVSSIMREEKDCGVNTCDYYRDFSVRVHGVREALRGLLFGLKEKGMRIAAYGAAAKGAVLLNYASIGAGVIDFIVDRNVHKHGLYMPGVHVPISPPERLLEEMPDYTLILAWNFASEIIGQQKSYRERGGKFILPLPESKIA